MTTRNFIKDVPLGYQQILAAALDPGGAALTLPNPSFQAEGGVSFAIITVETQAVRYRDDGVNPSATVGMPVATGQIVQLNGDLSRYRFISQTAGAILNVNYYGNRL